MSCTRLETWASAHQCTVARMGSRGFQAQPHLGPSQETARTQADGGGESTFLDFSKGPRRPFRMIHREHTLPSRPSDWGGITTF